MANEFTARNGLIAQKDSVVTGSLIVTSGITGSLSGTASYAAQALTASYASAYAAVFPYTGSAIISGSLEVPQVSGLNTSGGSLVILSTNNATKGTIDLGNNNAESVYLVNRQFQFTNVVLNAASNGNGFSITRVTPTDTLPNYVTNRADTTTGVGGTINTVSLITSGSTRLKASSAGNILIGTTTDAGYKFDVNGISRFNGNMSISGSGAFMAMTSNAGDAFAFRSNGAIRLEAQNVGILYASTTVTALYARGTTANIVLANQTTNFATMYGNTGNLSIQNGGTYTDSGYKLDVSGSVRIKGSANTSISSSLVVLGSGSSQPIFTVQGSQGELFSVTDSLSGSLFSVNDISGLPVLEAFSDNTVLLGSYQAPALLTTNRIVLTASGNFTLSSLPTASYDGAFYDYTARSGSNARAGSIMAIWSGSSVNFTETTTTDFGTTTGLSLGVFVSGANMVLTGSASTTAWTIKTIIRSI